MLLFEYDFQKKFQKFLSDPRSQLGSAVPAQAKRFPSVASCTYMDSYLCSSVLSNIGGVASGMNV